jgi:cytochrome c
MRECFSNMKDAVMYKLENLAAFSYKNVPKCNPDLTAEDAIDVASFVTAQQRFRFVPKKG